MSENIPISDRCVKALNNCVAYNLVEREFSSNR